MARRGKMDILADILRAAEKGGNKTRIVYGANLNFTLFKEYLKTLMEKGLIEKNGKKYYTTDLGMDYLRTYTYLQEMMDTDEKHMNHNIISKIDSIRE